MIDYTQYTVTLFSDCEKSTILHLVNSSVEIRNWESKNNASYFCFQKRLIKQGKIGHCIKSLWYRCMAHLYVRDIPRNYKYSLKSWSVCFGKKEYFDCVIAYQGLDYLQLLYANNNINAHKSICWLHCNIEFMNETEKSLLLNIYQKYDSIVCVSNSVKERLLYYYTKLDKKISVIYNLFNLDEINAFANQPITEKMDGLTFTTVGRVSPEKGQLMIPMIAKELLNLGYTFKWYIVGDGSDMEKLKKNVEEMSLEDTVILTGMKDNPYPYIKNCNLYIQPSYTEGFCLSTFEAKILGRHIIVTNVPGMREQFAENEAIFCEPTVPSLVNGIQRALETIDLPVPYKKVTDEFNQEQLRKIDKILS